MATFVLVHGAWGGSYGFRFVRRLLAAQGHEAITPSLTGIGERAHLTGPLVGLSTHVLDVVNAIRYEDLTDIVLVGFSYGGMVVTGALDHLDARVRELVYLDAFVPGDGESVVTITGGLPAEDSIGAPWSVPAGEREYDTPELAAWSNSRRSPQPILTLTQPVRLVVPLEERGIGLTYIRATEDPTTPFFAKPAEHASASPAWRYHEIATTHMVPENRPDELVSLLTALV